MSSRIIPLVENDNTLKSIKKYIFFKFLNLNLK